MVAYSYCFAVFRDTEIFFRRFPETENQVIQALPSELVMPPLETQQHLLDIYFTYAYPACPIVDKYQFLSKFRTMCVPPVSLVLIR